MLKKIGKKIMVMTLIVSILMFYFILSPKKLNARSEGKKIKLHGKFSCSGFLRGCDCTTRAYDCKCVLYL